MSARHELTDCRDQVNHSQLSPSQFGGYNTSDPSPSSSALVAATSHHQTCQATSSSPLGDRCAICQGAGSFSRRKKTCVLCLQQVCVDCIPDDPRTRTRRICSICQIITCNLTTRNQLGKLRTQHLVRFVDANRFDRRTCQDKTELVELILRSRNQFGVILRRALSHPRPGNPISNSPAAVATPLESRARLSAPYAPRMGSSVATSGSGFRNFANPNRQAPDRPRNNQPTLRPSNQQPQRPSNNNRTSDPSSNTGAAFSFSYNTGNVPSWLNGLQQSISTFTNGMTTFANSFIASPNTGGLNGLPSNFPQFTFTQTQSNQPSHWVRSDGPMSAGRVPAFTSTTTVFSDSSSYVPRQTTTTTTTTRMTFGQPDAREGGGVSRGQRPADGGRRQHSAGMRHGPGRRGATRRSSATEDGEETRPTPRPPSPPIPSVLLVQLKCLDDIERMSTKQMKELLNFHLVSTRGCLERSDLREKVCQLWEDEKEKRRIRDQSEQSTDAEGRHMCKVCMSDVVECVLVECGHMVTCLDCGKKLKKCPICRQEIVRVIKTFRA